MVYVAANTSSVNSIYATCWELLYTHRKRPSATSSQFTFVFPETPLKVVSLLQHYGNGSHSPCPRRTDGLLQIPRVTARSVLHFTNGSQFPSTHQSTLYNCTSRACGQHTTQAFGGGGAAKKAARYLIPINTS